MLHLTPERLAQLLHSQEASRLSPAARERLQLIVEFVGSGESISEICTRLNIVRSTFHRWLNRFDPNDLSTLEEQSHAPHESRSSNTSPEIITIIRKYRETSPLVGKELLREKLLSEHRICLSASTIGRIIDQECLYFGNTPLHWKKRMKYQSQVQQPVAGTSRSHLSFRSSEVKEDSSSDACTCIWCSFWRSHSRSMRRTLGIASIAINIALIGVYLTTVFWEQRSTEGISANIQLPQTGIVSNLDTIPFYEQ